jgi:hypothetical protein
MGLERQSGHAPGISFIDDIDWLIVIPDPQ